MLVKVYGVAPYDTRSIKREILQYLYICGKQDSKSGTPLPSVRRSADQAWANLKILQTRDPEFVGAFQLEIKKQVGARLRPDPGIKRRLTRTRPM